MKKIFALVLATLLIAASLTVAFAAVSDVATGKGGSASITITNAYVGETYKVYKIFDAVSDGSSSNISYTLIDGKTYTTKTAVKDDNNDETGEYTLGDSNGQYFKVDTNGNIDVLPAGKTSTGELSANAIAWIANNKGSVFTEHTVDAAETDGIRFTGLPYGYYYIETTTGTVVTVDSTNPNASVVDKNNPHGNEKKVEEDSTGAYGKVNDADIGQTVNFQSTITINSDGVKNLVFHDKMSVGLTYGSVTGITLNGNTVAADNYTVKTTGLTHNDCDFEIAFTEAFSNGLHKDDSIVVSYTATVNEDAEVVSTGNPNDSKITWGDASESEWDTTRTYTWKMTVIKQDGTDQTKLAGAKFTLARKTGSNTDPIAFVLKTGTEAATDETVAVYRVATAAEIADSNVTTQTEITTNKSGTFNIEGLDADTYVLTETEAPKGYNKVGPRDVVISTATAYGTDGTPTISLPTTTVDNNKGTELPSTGGIGTTLFYVGGGLLALIAVVLLVTKRRMTGND